MTDEEPNEITIDKSYIIVGAAAIIVFAVVTFLVVGNSTGEDTMTNEDVVATVNGEEITQEQVTALTENPNIQGEEQAVQELVAQEVLLQAADDSDITATQEEVEQLLQMQLQQENRTLDGFKQNLSEEGVEYSTVMEQYKDRVKTQKYLQAQLEDQSFEVTEQEIEQFYEQASQSQDLPPLDQVRAQLEQMVQQQKQQQAVGQLVQGLQDEAAITYS